MFSVVFGLLKMSFWVPKKGQLSFSERRYEITFREMDKKGLINSIIERLRSRLFGISREPRTSRSHVTTALASGLQFEVHVFTARPRSRGK